MGNLQSNSNFTMKPSELPQTFRSFFEKFPRRFDRNLKNPGLYHELDETWEHIQPKLFEGFRVSLSQGLTENIDMRNTIKIDPSKPHEYNISSTISSNADFPLVWCELDQKGLLKTKFKHHVTDRILLNANTRLYSNYFEVPKCSVDYRGDDFSATVLFRFIRNPIRSNCCLCGQYLQTVSKNFALGFEYSYTFESLDPSNVALVGRYSLYDSILTGKIQKNGAQIRYWREINPLFQIGLEVQTDFFRRDATGAVSYQMSLPKYGSIVRGSLDSRFNAFVVAEKKSLNYPFSLSLTLAYNCLTNNMKTGCGIGAHY